MEQEIKHTALPYHIRNKTDIMKDNGLETSRYIAKAQWDNEHPDGQDEANAEFIVRACNSHYELLGSLKDIAFAKTWKVQNQPMELVKIALAAITKAEASHA